MSRHLDHHIGAVEHDKKLRENDKLPAPEIPLGTHPEDEPRTRIMLWLLLVVGVIFLALILFRSVYNPTVEKNTVSFNNFYFEELADGFWQFEWQQEDRIYQVPLRFNPAELDNVTATGTLSRDFGRRKNVYIAIEPKETRDQEYVALAGAELGINLVKVFGVNPVASCTKNFTTPCASRPIINCENSTKKSVIELLEGDGPRMEMKGDCITLQGNKMELLQAVDRLLYKFYKVMD